MKLLDNIITRLLYTYKEGQLYFSTLDKSIQHKLIVDKLLSITSENNIIIVSGGFGKFVKKINPKKKILLLNGGLRHLHTLSLKHINEKLNIKILFS